jgi:hypothetical protein
MIPDGYKYSEGSYVIKYCTPKIDSDVFDAFQELENFLHANLLADGTLDPLALTAHKARTMGMNMTSPKITLPDGYKVEYEGSKSSDNGLYCNCSKPDIKIPKDKVEGKEFDYCKACKKERLEQKSNTGWGSWNPNTMNF